MESEQENRHGILRLAYVVVTIGFYNAYLGILIMTRTHGDRPVHTTVRFIALLIGLALAATSSPQATAGQASANKGGKAQPANHQNHAAPGESDVTVTPDLKSPERMIPADFIGLSLEISNFRPDEHGNYLFSGKNAPLIGLFKSLGVRSLRMGGNSVDSGKFPLPASADVDRLYAFAKAAGAHVIFNLRLKDLTDPSVDVRLARYIMAKYKNWTTCFTIGNEPDMYIRQFEDYRNQWEKVEAAVLAAVPDAQFNGPSTAFRTEWLQQTVDAFAASGHLQLLTTHKYPGGNARKLPSEADARAYLLSPAIMIKYQKLYAKIAPLLSRKTLRLRLEETNSLSMGGRDDVSNSYASALWGLDYLHWWAAHRCEGLNFHTNVRVARDEKEIPGGYDVLYSAPSGYKVHPLAYAMKAFHLAAEGRIISVRMESGRERNVTAYGSIDPNKVVFITVINKETGPRDAVAVTLDLGHGYSRAQEIRLSSPQNDIALLSGTTLGGAGIEGDGSWRGKWASLRASGSQSRFLLRLPPATAAVIKVLPDKAASPLDSALN